MNVKDELEYIIKNIADSTTLSAYTIRNNLENIIHHLEADKAIAALEPENVPDHIEKYYVSYTYQLKGSRESGYSSFEATLKNEFLTNSIIIRLRDDLLADEENNYHAVVILNIVPLVVEYPVD